MNDSLFAKWRLASHADVLRRLSLNLPPPSWGVEDCVLPFSPKEVYLCFRMHCQLQGLPGNPGPPGPTGAKGATVRLVVNRKMGQWVISELQSAFQCEGSCPTYHKKMRFIFMRMNTHFQIKEFAL